MSGNYQIAQMGWYGGENRKWRVPRAKVRSDIYDAVSVLGISQCGSSPGETVPRRCRGGFAPPRPMLCRRSYHDRAPGGRTCLRPVLAGACARKTCCRATRQASRSPMQCARCRRNRVGRPVPVHRDAQRLCRSCTDSRRPGRSCCRATRQASRSPMPEPFVRIGFGVMG